MKKIKVIGLAFSFIALILMAGCSGNIKSLEKNYGYAYGEVNIGPDGAQVLSIGEIVPSKSELITNLKEAGFMIAEYDTALDSDTAAERIYAEKKGLFIDICYGLSVEQAKDIFENYEAAYKDYYLMAQNEAYVYAVSDEETFKMAGFESLETSGILFIWK